MTVAQSTQSEIVESQSKRSPELSGNKAVRDPLKSIFADSAHWDGLADKHLSAFNLPEWEEGCTPEMMLIWIERLDFTAKDYQQHTNTTLEQFVSKNPSWPLRAFIGTVLEMIPV